MSWEIDFLNAVQHLLRNEFLDVIMLYFRSGKCGYFLDPAYPCAAYYPENEENRPCICHCPADYARNWQYDHEAPGSKAAALYRKYGH